ncbi:MAG: hypothetical protein HPY90_04180 [Syntrophothermus sp.]|uniref:hypothetical protein n=1 Tax=Syntrophothermus sp. TaxID=2736299 RepID=UPI00257F6DCC|nr:hypothetical protein [Syntrophothermus sp.]NSW82465.1 hypothetical protein [Syntrophothermus sp.]
MEHRGYRSCWRWLGLALAAGLFLWWLGYFFGIDREVTVSGRDLDGDGVLETYVLKGRILTVSEEDKLIWESPSDWKVEDFLIADVTNDGQEELVMTVWVRGRFGKHRPFWVSGDDGKWWNHLYLYRLVGNQMKPVWMSSGLERPVLELEAGDVDGDKALEMIVTESRYRWLSYSLRRFPLGRERSVWRWNGWGFSRL